MIYMSSIELWKLWTIVYMENQVAGKVTKLWVYLRPWWSRFFCQFMLQSSGIESISFSAKLSQINRQVGNARWLHAVLISVLEPEPIDGGAEIKLPPGAKVVIMIYGYGSESLLFFQRLKILWKKVIGVVGVTARVLSVTRAFLPLRRSRVLESGANWLG